ncbi:hypothetical protein CPAR01_05641 [Colletotrichum paranaense]|uniref:Uncharacterized protein n=1 Tax=Colletotrichum paranaense TaxID=1914294 RepID=A0ABQ9SRW1_9PEZI|nr:uncharacterized protein CPAR01_05641 [Colletotrichum paranaense]KAK1542254.1 hypothetical protein CPAR01_05641 [Colletotrichum paranaense]
MGIATSLKLNRLEPDDLSIEPPLSNICRRAPHKVSVLSFMEDLSLFAMLTITANALALAKDDLAINLTIGPRLPRPLRPGAAPRSGPSACSTSSPTSQPRPFRAVPRRLRGFSAIGRSSAAVLEGRC